MSNFWHLPLNGEWRMANVLLTSRNQLPTRDWCCYSSLFIWLNWIYKKHTAKHSTLISIGSYVIYVISHFRHVKYIDYMAKYSNLWHPRYIYNKIKSLEYYDVWKLHKTFPWVELETLIYDAWCIAICRKIWNLKYQAYTINQTTRCRLHPLSRWGR